MTNTTAIAIAFSLIINNFTLIYHNCIITDEHPESKLVFLLSVCLILRKINVVPNVIRSQIPFICSMIEIPLALIVLESSLLYIWGPLKDYLLSHSEDILVYFYEEFEYFFCPLCNGKGNCSETFACFLLRASTFAFLLMICSTLGNSKR